MISRSGTRRSGAASGAEKILRDEGRAPVVTAGRVVSGLGRMFMAFLRFETSRCGSMRIDEKAEDGASCGFNHLFEPGFYPRIGVGVLRDVADHGDRVRAGGINL